MKLFVRREKVLKYILISSVTTTLVITGFYTGVLFESRFGNSRQQAFSSGTAAATIQEFNKAYRDGVSQGISQGIQKGYQEGLNEGVEIGNDTGFKKGYTKGHNTGYNQAKTEYGNPPFYDKNFFVKFKGEVEIGEINFVFKENVSQKSLLENNNHDTPGIAYSKNQTIFIKTGRMAYGIDRTCNHEMLHLMFPNYKHPEGDEKFEDPVYTLSQKIDLKICNSLTSEVINKST